MTPPGGREETLVASCLAGGGGLLVRAGDGWRRLDHVGSTGLAVSADGTRVARALWTSDDPQTHGELVISDAVGVLRYLRVDALQEPHGLLWDGDLVVAVSTLLNRLLWIDAAGRVEREEVFPGAGDAWHLNCAAWADDRVVVTAFGQHRAHRDWARTGATRERGVLLDVASGATIADGLTAPHDPVRLEDGWLVCDSGTGRVLRLDDDGTVVQAADLHGWTRGVAIDGAVVHVGVSARRAHGGGGTARVVTLRLADLSTIAEVAVPSDEIFALEFVPDALVAGLDVGFSVNAARTVPLAPPGSELASARSWLVAEPAAVLRFDAPDSTDCGRFLAVQFEVELQDRETLFPVGAAAWQIGARWVTPGAPPRDDGARARLAAPVLQGCSGNGVLRVRAPDVPGTHQLEIGLVQEHRRWHATARASATIEVTAGLTG